MTSKFFDDEDSFPLGSAAKKFFDDHDSLPIDPAVPGDASNVSFGSYVTDQIPIVGTLANMAGSGGAALVKKIRGDERDIAKIYDAEKVQHDADIAAYRKQNPGLGVVGTLAGGAALPLPGGPLLKQVGINAAASAADAGLKGESMGQAAALGAGITGAFGGIGRAISSMPSLRDYAARRAVKAAGAMTKDMRALEDKGLLESTGRELLDQGIVKLGSSLEDIAESAGKAKEKAGEAIGAAIKKADENVAKAKQLITESDLFKSVSDDGVKNALVDSVSEFGFSPRTVADRITKELIEPNLGDPTVAAQVKKLATLVEGFDNSGAKTLQGGLSIKSNQRRMTAFDSDSIPQGFRQDVYKIIKEELENGVAKSEALKSLSPNQLAESLFLKTPAPKVVDAGSDFAKANKQYAIMANTEDMAQRRFGAAQSNRENSLTDTLAEGFGLLHGGIGGAAALGAANKAIRRWGSSSAAVGANELAKTLEAAPQALKDVGGALKNAVSNNNAAKGTTNLIRDTFSPRPLVPEFAQEKKLSASDKIKMILQERPDALGRYAPALKSAMERGGNAYAVTHYLLQQRDPEYRELVRHIDE